MPSDRVAERLESRLPQPVEDEVAWFSETDDDEDGDDEFEKERQRQLPHGVVDSGTGLGHCHRLIDVGKVSILVVADALLIRDAALTEEQVDQLGRVHAGVRIREGQQGRSEGDDHDFGDGIFAEFRRLAETTPPDVALDEQRS